MEHKRRPTPTEKMFPTDLNQFRLSHGLHGGVIRIISMIKKFNDMELGRVPIKPEIAERIIETYAKCGIDATPVYGRFLKEEGYAKDLRPERGGNPRRS